MASTTTPIPEPLAAPPFAGPLADEIVDRDATGGPEVLVVGVAGRRWAIRLEEARQVIRARAVTRVPGAPAWVMGVLNVRGSVVPVGDLRALDGRARVAAREGLVLLVEERGRQAGLRVAEVVGVRPAELTVHPDDGEGASAASGGLPAAGVARLTPDGASSAEDPEGAEVPLLDVRAVLDELLDGDAHS